MDNLELNSAISALLPHTTYELMDSPAQREALFQLRYAAYLREGAIEPHASGHLHDEFDEQANSFNIGVRIDDRLIGAMRICVWNRSFGFETTPGLDAFAAELAPYLNEDTVLIDPNRFVIDATFTQNKNSFAFLVMRISFMACIKFNATFTIATARREHIGFYLRAYGHKRITEPRYYSGLIKPLALLLNDFPVNQYAAIAKYPSLGPQGDDLEKLFDALASKSVCLENEQR